MFRSAECPVCRSVYRDEIATVIERGDDLSEVAQRTGFQIEALREHAAHVTEYSVEVDEESGRETLLRTLRRNAARLESAIKLSQHDSNSTLFLRANAELVKNIALQDNLANNSHTEETSTETGQIRSLARKMLSAVSDSPEMQNAISDALRRQFGDDDENANYEY